MLYKGGGPYEIWHNWGGGGGDRKNLFEMGGKQEMGGLI